MSCVPSNISLKQSPQVGRHGADGGSSEGWCLACPFGAIAAQLNSSVMYPGTLQLGSLWVSVWYHAARLGSVSSDLMRSKYADYFNHDEDAEGYDQDVQNEHDPIRAGYRAVLRWVGENVKPDLRVLDLGSGTGNTIIALPPSCRVTAVDVSIRMTELARSKLSGRRVEFMLCDILEFFDTHENMSFDAVVSTHTLHHLSADEKMELFRRVSQVVPLTAPFVIGDLMYEGGQAGCERILREYSEAHPSLATDFADEFFWDIVDMKERLSLAGWRTSWRRFSDLSWGVVARRG